jgi:hypothetical protein
MYASYQWTENKRLKITLATPKKSTANYDGDGMCDLLRWSLIKAKIKSKRRRQCPGVEIIT